MSNNIIDAIQSLIPNAEVIIRDDNIEWINPKNPGISKEQILLELNRLNNVYNSKEYQRLRQPEYPPITDYLDGVVKDDQQQIAAYIAACQAVKAKYPKPE